MAVVAAVVVDMLKGALAVSKPTRKSLTRYRFAVLCVSGHLTIHHPKQQHKWILQQQGKRSFWIMGSIEALMGRTMQSLTAILPASQFTFSLQQGYRSTWTFPSIESHAVVHPEDLARWCSGAAKLQNHQTAAI